ncbi:MAG: DNA repair protein RecO [Gammaproteobacteria bacterium]
MQNKLEKSYILHQRAFSESSLILEVFTENLGRFSLLAKGAKRPKSFWRGLLVPFRPLLLSWTGRSDLKTLTQAEADGKSALLVGTKLWCGLYLNELLMRLLSMGDPHDDIYKAYEIAVTELDKTESEESVLRCFERDLLEGLGYGIEYCDFESGDPIEPEVLYIFDPAQGFSLLREANGKLTISGASILALARGAFENAHQLKEAKMLLQSAIQVHLGNKPLQTKQLFREVRQFI